MIIFILNTILLLSLFIVFTKHPLSMGLILLMQIICVALVTGLMSFNFWTSYILFIIMIGGMLVLFVYMTSIASNEKFNYSSLKMKITLLIFIMPISMFMLVEKFDMNYNFKNYEMIEQYNFIMVLSKFMNYPYNSLLFSLIIYLFITLIAVVKISKINHGPLRQSN